jgi:hypothetical protein
MVALRASQNGPYITIKYEAKTKKEYDQIKTVLSRILTKHKQVNWGQGVNTTALINK